MSSSLVSTPASQNLGSSAVQVTKRTPHTPSPRPSNAPKDTPSPGQWRHPKFDEIARRHTAATFDHSDFVRILWNVGALVAGFAFSDIMFSVLHAVPIPFQPWIDVALALLLYGLPLFNISRSLHPLFRAPDNINDIDLSPTQRALMGLDPKATPPKTPGTHYVTPPKYQRSVMPRSNGSAGAWSNVAAVASSGGSMRGSPMGGRFGNEWPSPASAPSPMWQKSVGIGGGERRRHSYGLAPLPPPSPVEGGSVFAPNTPSPVDKGSPLITTRWIYNQGRSRSGYRNSLTGF